MDGDTWKIENSICRCCHAEGYFFNLGEPRPFCGQTEVYADMIRDIFDIDMRPLPGPLCELTYTICMSCIFKLREAIQFKKQVQACEDKFLDYYYTNKLEVVKKQDVTKAVIKIEPVEFKEEYLNEDEFDSNDDTNQDVAMQDDNDDDDDDDDDEEDSKLAYLLKGKGKGKGKSESVKVKSESVKGKSESVKGKSVPVKAKPAAVKVVVKAESAPVKSEQKTTNKKLVKVNKITVPVKKKGNPADDKRYAISTNEDGTKDFTCRLCQRVYKKQYLAVQHYKGVHLKIRPRLRSCYLCDVSVPSYLRPAHMEEAHGIPKPACNACGKKFSFQFQLLRHQRTFHMGEMDYECDICHKKFANTTGINRHMVLHQTEKPYQCDFCDKSFKAKKYLKNHMAIHLNDKRYACAVCGERFVQTSSLKYHMSRKHGDQQLA